MKITDLLSPYSGKPSGSGTGSPEPTTTSPSGPTATTDGSTSVTSTTASSPKNGNGNGDDKVTGKDKVKPPKAAPEYGGMSIAAVWASQADRRAEEAAAADAAREKSRTLPGPQAITDGSNVAARVVENTVKEVEARRAEDAKAQAERRPEKKREPSPFERQADDPFRPEKDEDPFRRDEAERIEPRAAKGLDAYRAAFEPKGLADGSQMDGLF